jgi:hypothetical protein
MIVLVVCSGAHCVLSAQQQHKAFTLRAHGQRKLTELVEELIQSGRKNPEGFDPSGRHSFATSEESEGGILE